MTTTLKKTTIFLLLVFVTGFFGYGQNLGLEYSLHVSQEYANNQVDLNWSGKYAGPVVISRKLKNERNWVKVGETEPEVSSYVDTGVIEGYLYEYKLEMNNSANDDASFNSAYGYITLDLRNENVFTRKPILVLVSGSLHSDIKESLEKLSQDLMLDGYNPYIEVVSNDKTAAEVKTIVGSYYYKKYIEIVYIIGHVAVPYSGFHAPDGHSDHLGAWPADGFYGDMNDELWTENPIFNYYNARDSRNTNTNSDGKYDQNVFPSELELIVSRADFSSLPVFGKTEAQLTNEYLARVSEWRNGRLKSNGKGIIQDDLSTIADGFGNNFYRNFSPVLSNSNLDSGSYFNELQTDNYLVAHGISYADDTSAFTIGSSYDLAQNETNATFKLLTGSYFGDWDTPDNFLRVNLASGNTLNALWTGRPNYFLHGLAANSTIGECFRTSCNNGIGNIALYEPKGLYTNSTSMNLLGDPTVRLSHKLAIINLATELNDSLLRISWDKLADIPVTGFVVSRYNNEKGQYEVLDEVDANQTNYYDFIRTSGRYEYIVNAIYKEGDYAISYNSYSQGKHIATEVNLDDYNHVGILPTNLVLKATPILEEFYEFELTYNAYDTSYYTLVLQKEIATGWNDVSEKTILKDNKEEAEQKVFLYDSIEFNTPNNYRAVCYYSDSSIVSADTMINIGAAEFTTLYPSPNREGIIFISGPVYQAEDISVLNNLGQEQEAVFDSVNQSLTLKGYRKGLYMIKIEDTLYKIVLVK